MFEVNNEEEYSLLTGFPAQEVFRLWEEIKDIQKEEDQEEDPKKDSSTKTPNSSSSSDSPSHSEKP